MFTTFSTIISKAPLEEGGIIFIELAVLSAFIIAFAGNVSRNPYSLVGGSREVILAFLIEPAIIASVLNMVLLNNTLSLEVTSGKSSLEISWLLGIFSYLLCLIGECGRVPFDFAEAESELTGGTMIEFSGYQLAMMKFSQHLKLLALLSILNLYLTSILPIQISQDPLIYVISYLSVLILGTIFVSLAESLNARYRLKEASKFYAFVFILALTALIFTILGIAAR